MVLIVEIMASKMQKMRSSKPDEKGQVKVTITNAYEINAVPKNQKDFIAYFTEHGVDLDKMLFLTNPDVFMGQKTADMRKLLFSMASTKTDQEIASNFAREKAIAEYESLSESEADKTTVDDLEEKYMLCKAKPLMLKCCPVTRWMKSKQWKPHRRKRHRKILMQFRIRSLARKHQRLKSMLRN